MMLTPGRDGRWVPAEPLPEPFGVRWGSAWKFRRGLGQGPVQAFVGGWFDARAVDRMAVRR